MPRARACADGLRTNNYENRQLTTDASLKTGGNGDADAILMKRMMR